MKITAKKIDIRIAIEVVAIEGGNIDMGIVAIKQDLMIAQQIAMVEFEI